VDRLLQAVKLDPAVGAGILLAALSAGGVGTAGEGVTGAGFVGVASTGSEGTGMGAAPKPKAASGVERRSIPAIMVLFIM
jgi:hypothetical protein